MRLVSALTAGLLLATPALGATWVVDGNGGGNWKSLAAIDWARIRPGDRLRIAGSQRYAGPLDVQASGTPDRPVVIEAEGGAVIDGGNRLEWCVRVDGSDRVEVRGLAVRDCVDAGFRIRNATGVTIERNSVHAPARAFHVWRTSGVTIADNEVTTPDHVELQTDGIYSQENRGNRYLRNRIVISNGEPEGHDDGIQSYKDADLLIAGNYIEQRNAKTGNAQGIFITVPAGRMTVVDNTVYGPNTRNGLVTLLNQEGSSGSLDAFHNTLVGSQWGVIQIEDAPGSRIRNNILYSTAPNAAGITVKGAMPAPADVDHNLYFLPRGRPGYAVDGADFDWRSWRARGFERNGISADPRLADIARRRFVPVAGSPALGAAAALPGLTRDVPTADIGAAAR